MKRYIIVGGRPFTMYTGTTTYTGLDIVGTTDTLEDAGLIVREKYEQCGGLIVIINAEAGTVVTGG
jgi:hypothetical protein